VIRIACALALVSSGCRPPSHYDVFVDDSVPAAWVEESVAEWSASTTATFDVRYSSDESCAGHDGCMRIIGTSRSVTESIGVHPEPDSPAVTPCETRDLQPDHCVIYIDVSMSDTDGVGLMVHEMGHAMRLQHESGHCVMNPDTPASPHHVACCDVRQWNDLRGFRTGKCVDVP
jgi:hypothetical protein